MTDINERIAKAKGWTYERCVVCNGKHWYDNVKYIQKNPPDYTTDWRLAGGLLEEMAKCEAISITQFPQTWGIWINNNEVIAADTPQMAIALAWLEWRLPTPPEGE